MATQPVPDRAPPLRPRPFLQAPPHLLIGPASRTDPSLVLTTQLQDLSILVGVGNSALGVSCRPRRGILDGFASCARTALLQGLHPSQGHQGLGWTEQSASQSPYLYRDRCLWSSHFLCQWCPSPPAPSQTTHPSALHLTVGFHRPWNAPSAMNRYVQGLSPPLAPDSTKTEQGQISVSLASTRSPKSLLNSHYKSSGKSLDIIM